ncbi:MAG: hypothetical protein M1524_03915 [Patescibacteria group bacterium]|nr:hypothetical protein [Patescibacteria group bacterium]
MKYKLGIFGSAVEEKDEVTKKARKLGELLGKYRDKIIVITGACSGIPYQVGSEAAKKGVEIWGYSPCTNLKGQKDFTPKDDISIYSKLIYVPKNFEFSSNLDISKKYRNVVSTANCDAGIIISGRWGTMNEFTSLYDFGKVIGILTATGGTADANFF